MSRFFSSVLLSLLMCFPLIAGTNQQSIRAYRTPSAPNIDGRLDDEVWNRAVSSATDFTQRDPHEGQPASEGSEVRILYDDAALYFGCRLLDSEPEKIVVRLARRDSDIESDRFSIYIDSYHDHQSGYEFTFNAAGVKIDVIQYADGNEADDSWDPVWEVQTVKTSEGWSAEVRVPFRILRYLSEDDSSGQTWGINFIRYISRKQEEARWAFTPKSESGFISRFGQLVGLANLPDPRQVELLPFVVSKQSYEPANDFQYRRERFSSDAGLDIRYGLSKNFTVDATINPDFGQVEADPAVLNLSTFETFYPEKRPFFIDGTQIIRFSTFGGDFGPGMFYSRRIGRAISTGDVQVPEKGMIDELPQSVTILGAAKITGRTNGGLSIGVLQALTEREGARVLDSLGNGSDQTVEPLSHYNIVRLKQDILGNSYVGAMVTTTARESRYPGLTNGWDWNLKLSENTYQISGFAAFSRTTNRSNERVMGSAGKLAFSRIAGEHWTWTLSGDYTTKRYNINDVGFFFSPDDIGHVALLTYRENTPAQMFRNYSITGLFHQRWTFDGANIAREVNLSTGLLFTNYWRLSLDGSTSWGLYDHRESRGNGLYRKPHESSIGISLQTDSRSDIIAAIDQSFGWDNHGRSGVGVEVGVELRPLSWMQYQISYEGRFVRHQEAWTKTLSTSEVIFGDRDTDDHSITLRASVTFTRELTMQLYTQVFQAKQFFQNHREFQSPNSFTPYAGATDLTDANFHRKFLSSNLVLRWEYLPGSTLYLVWSQARYREDGIYDRSFREGFDETFRLPPANVILAKASYWLNM